jgi:hypothetical protein
VTHDYDLPDEPLELGRPALAQRDALVEHIDGGYAPPPSDGPIGVSYRMGVARLAAVGESIERMADPDDALKAHGCELTMADLAQLVQQTTDPYWAWALNLLQTAAAVTRTNVSQGIWDIATDPGHKDRMRALQMYAESHVTGFKKKSSVEVTQGGVVEVRHLTEKTNNLLLTGDMSVTRLSRRLHGEEEIVDAEFEEMPALEKLETGQVVHPAFRLKR